MARDAYVKIEGVDGESTDDAHKDWIEITAYDHTVSQQTVGSVSSNGGLTGEKTDHSVFQIFKAIDKASPKLLDKCSTGETIPSIELSLNRAAGGKGDKVEYMHYKFSPAMITKVETIWNADGTLPIEKVCWSYGKVEWTYTQQKTADGSGGGKVAAGWDNQKNKAV